MLLSILLISNMNYVENMPNLTKQLQTANEKLSK